MAKTITDDQDIQLMIVSDIHYLSPALTDNGTEFQKVLASGDSKMADYSTEILNELIHQAEEIRPDAVIISGDLTYNGEKRSLLDLKDQFKVLEDEDIPVLIIPGNHDISYPMAYNYQGDTYTPTDNVSEKQFKELMQDYGYNEAQKKDASSFSYCTHVSDSVWLLFLDADTEEYPGSLSDEELDFAEEVMKEADQKKACVIPVTHQNILPPSSLLSEGFTIKNCDELKKILKKYGVSLCLSGHSHLQRTCTDDSLTQIITESLSVYPLQFGLLEIDSAGWTYENRELGILKEESEKRFRESTVTQVDRSLQSLSVSSAEKKIMEDYAVRVNEAYFTGKKTDISENDEGYILYQKYLPDSFWYAYLNAIIADQK